MRRRWECQGPNNGGMGMNAMNGVFMNPMAAPYLFGISDVEHDQIGAMMLMNQMGDGGIGSGQLSGVRPGAGQSKGRTKQPPTKARGTTATPGRIGGAVF